MMCSLTNVKSDRVSEDKSWRPDNLPKNLRGRVVQVAGEYPGLVYFSAIVVGPQMPSLLCQN